MASKELHEIHCERNVLIRLDDGVELSADLYLPNAPGRYPAVISNFTGYRKDDLNGAQLAYVHRYFAECGYASLMVDVRGTGSSAGDLADRNSKRETDDGVQVVEWAAAQDWCDGGVAVWGASWGGGTALLIAAERPPHLKAIAPIVTAARGRWDTPGGCTTRLGTAIWTSQQLAFDLAPPGFQDRDGRWMRVWRERLRRLQRGDLQNFERERHKDDDEYLQASAIAVDQIEVPTFAISGWRDAFVQGMVDIYERVAGPRKLLVGPWAHAFPHQAGHAAVDLPRELVRFFDHWLKGEQSGVADEPEVTLYVQGAERWKHEREWPIARTQLQEWHLQPGRALGPAPGDGSDTYCAGPTVGTSTAPGAYGYDGAPGSPYPSDQAEDDLRSLAYTSGPLEHGVEITGSPEAIVRVALEDGDELQLVAKLSAVAPDGRSTLITTGDLSAAYRESLERGQLVEVGIVAEYRIPLYATSYHVPAGHRIRLAIACSDFPRIWPLRTNPTIRVELAGSLLRVPVVPEPTEPIDEPALPPPDPAADVFPWGAPRALARKVERDAVTGAVSVENATLADIRTPTGTTFRWQHSDRATVTAPRPDAAAAHTEESIDVHLPGGEHAEVHVSCHVTRDALLINGDVTLDGVRFLTGTWQAPDN